MAKKALRVAELDFDTIKYNLKKYLQSQTEFTDYDFEGSGLSILIDLLAYNTHYNAVIGNMLLQEMYLDTAVKKESLSLISKRLGYVPKGYRSAVATVDVDIYPDPAGRNIPQTAYIHKNTPFDAYVNDNTRITFITRDSYAANLVNNKYSFKDVQIFEGSLASYKYTVNTLVSQKFEIPSRNVDTTKLRVFIQTNSSSTDIVEWVKQDNIVDVGPESQVYFLKLNENLNYEIYFGDNNIGQRPVFGNVVIIEYITTNGAISNHIDEFTYSSSIDNALNIIVTTKMRSIGGSDPESLDSIRINAQNSVFVQNRAVVATDYENIIDNIISIDSISVYGGETIVPPKYGKVFICLKQSGTELPLSDTQKQLVLREIKKSCVLSLSHEIIDPAYTYVSPTCVIRYNQDKTTLSEETLKTSILNRLLDYGNNSFNTFNAVFEYSRFVSYIDDIDPCIIANTTRLKLYKKQDVVLDINEHYSFDFNCAIEQSNSNEINITSSAFRTAEFPDNDLFVIDNAGNIDVYYTLNGEKKIAYKDIGIVNYSTGVIRFNIKIGLSYTPQIRITVIPVDMNISVQHNNILIMNESDINLVMNRIK